MKTSEQIVVGGPYRSLDLENRRRRAELINEIDFLENVELWQEHAKLEKITPRRRSLYLSLLALAEILSLVSIVLNLAEGNVFLASCTVPVLMTLIGTWYYDFRLWFRWRHRGDATQLIRQKFVELAELPPE